MQKYKSLSDIGNELLEFIMNVIAPDLYKSWLTNTKYKFPVDFYDEYLCEFAESKGHKSTGYIDEYKHNIKYDELFVSQSPWDEGKHINKLTYHSSSDLYFDGTSYDELEKYLKREISEYLQQCPAIYQNRVSQYGRNFKPSNEIEELEYQKLIKESGQKNNNTKQKQPAVNKFSSTDELMIDFLKRNGITAHKGEENIIYFDYEGRHFLNMNYDTENGFSYMTIRLDSIYPVSDDDMNHCLQVVNNLNRDSFGKYFIEDYSVNIDVTILIDSTPEMDELVPPLIKHSLLCYDEFNKAIQE